MQFYASNKHLLDSIFKRFKVVPVQAFSVVAPEVGHYAVWRDVMETSAMKLFYAEMGTDYADFSTGYFQMKVSFIEKVEEAIEANGPAELKTILAYPIGDKQKIREERLRRMERLDYQACYLASFFRIIETSLKPKDIQECAGLYNGGFWKTKEEVARLRALKSFPSKGNVRQRFSYSEIAGLYYKALTR